MPLYRVGGKTESRLLKASESGMGFQVVQYRAEFLVVFQTTLIIPLNELRARKFSKEDYQALSGNPDSEAVSQLDPLDMYDDFSMYDDLTIAFSVLDREHRISETGLTANDTTISPPDTVISPSRPYSYYRFSAFNKDKRIDADGSFLPNTYATTYNDLHFVPSGFAAVGRYALPNPASAQFVFSILTYDQPTLMGTATPNFGQAGGGVEVLFQKRAQNRTGLSFIINAG